MGSATDGILYKSSECHLDGDRHVPGIWGDGSKRKLDLNWWSNDWNQNYRFLSVRN